MRSSRTTIITRTTTTTISSTTTITLTVTIATETIRTIINSTTRRTTLTMAVSTMVISDYVACSLWHLPVRAASLVAVCAQAGNTMTAGLYLLNIVRHIEGIDLSILQRTSAMGFTLAEARHYDACMRVTKPSLADRKCMHSKRSL